MPWNEIEEAESLLYVAGALPTGRKLRILVRTLLDPRFSRDLRRLRAEQAAFERETLPGLASRLGVPSSRNASAVGHAFPLIRAVLARAWSLRKGTSARPRIVFAGIVLSCLMGGFFVMIQSAEGFAESGNPSTWTLAEGPSPRPLLILGY